MTIHMTDGQQFEETRRDSKGDPEAPLDDSEMRRKAEQLLDYAGVSTARATQIIDGVLALAEAGAPEDILLSIGNELGNSRTEATT